MERFHDHLERSFLPGRSFTDADDFNIQLAGWLSTANVRVKRPLGCARSDRLGADLAAMMSLPPVPPQVGWRFSTRLPRDYCVRLDGNDYSIHPSVIGRRVEVHGDLTRLRANCHGRLLADHQRVWANCHGRLVADHQRVWAKHQTVSYFGRLVAAKALQRGRADLVKPLPDTDVRVRDLASYDAFLGIHGGVDDSGGSQDGAA